MMNKRHLFVYLIDIFYASRSHLFYPMIYLLIYVLSVPQTLYCSGSICYMYLILILHVYLCTNVYIIRCISLYMCYSDYTVLHIFRSQILAVGEQRCTILFCRLQCPNAFLLKCPEYKKKQNENTFLKKNILFIC